MSLSEVDVTVEERIVFENRLKAIIKPLEEAESLFKTGEFSRMSQEKIGDLLSLLSGFKNFAQNYFNYFKDGKKYELSTVLRKLQFESNLMSHVSGQYLDTAYQDQLTKTITKLYQYYGRFLGYKNGKNPELMLPSFTGNHDKGRFGYFLRDALPEMSDTEALARTTLAHGLMIFARGIPVIYYGDEQGFVGDGHDYHARENMFPSKVASYNDNNLVGSDATTATSNFDTSHPLFRTLAKFNALHQAIKPGAQLKFQCRCAAVGVGCKCHLQAPCAYVFMRSRSV